jgi:hypothetical protein
MEVVNRVGADWSIQAAVPRLRAEHGEPLGVDEVIAMV